MYTQINHVDVSYVYTSMYVSYMTHAESRATRIRASSGEVLPLCLENGMMSRAAARSAAAVRVKPVVRGRQHRRRRRLPVTLPLVDEPVIDLLRVQPRRFRQCRFLQLLHPHVDINYFGVAN
jgi:hypothetical protein